MRILSLAVKNLKHNFPFYVLYLCSVSFVLAIFFSFTSFSMNTVMLEKISGDGRVETMCRTISAFLMAFVVFYLSYANRFFLRRRVKELGIYALLGCRKASVLVLLAAENLLICLGAFAAGVLLGAVFHQAAVFCITALLGLSVQPAGIPFFNPGAIAKTARFVFALVAVLAVSNCRFLYQTSLMGLVRFEKSAEHGAKPRALPALIGLCAILSGYALALDILRGTRSVWFTVGFSPVGLLTLALVVAGTVLFLAFSLPFAVQAGKRSRRKFYTETRIITAPGFVYQMHSNARTLIMLTLLSAATLTISSVMALTLYYPIAAVSRMAPSELECRIVDGREAEAIRHIVSKHSSETDVTFLQTDLYKVTAAGQLPAEYYAGTAQGDARNEKIPRDAGFECISYSGYCALLEAQGRERALAQIPPLAEGECILVKYQPPTGRDETGDVYPLQIGGAKIPVTVAATTLDNPISCANSIGSRIVSDSLYDTMAQALTPETKVLSINGASLQDNEALYLDLLAYLKGSPYLQGHSHRIRELFSWNSSTFLLIGFLVLLFFVASGSILYFNNLTAAADSRADYEILWKMGYSARKIRVILRRQVQTFFLIPLLFGLADCIFATIVYKTALMQSISKESLVLYLPALVAILMTFAVYGVYFCLTVRACCQAVLTK